MASGDALGDPEGAPEGFPRDEGGPGARGGVPKAGGGESQLLLCGGVFIREDSVSWAAAAVSLSLWVESDSASEKMSRSFRRALLASSEGCFVRSGLFSHFVAGDDGPGGSAGGSPGTSLASSLTGTSSS